MRHVNETSPSGKIQTEFQFAKALPTAKKASPRITLRLTQEELTTLKTLSSGMSLSAYVRKCVFGKHAKPRKMRARAPVENHQALAQVLGLLGQTRFANNLNQLAHQANCGSLLMDEQTENEIRMACAHIAWIRLKLVEALGLKS
jgi:Mobilization protein NikA